MFAAVKESASPSTNGTSGPIATKPMLCSWQNCSTYRCSLALLPKVAQPSLQTRAHGVARTALWSLRSSHGMACTFSSAAMPGLPGAQYSVSQSVDWASFHASACSRPPPPTTSALICIAHVVTPSCSGG